MDVFLDWRSWLNNTIWKKGRPDIKKDFDSKPGYNLNFSETKIKSHGDEVTDFYHNKIPKIHLNYPCLAVISLGSPIKKDGNFLKRRIFKTVQIH